MKKQVIWLLLLGSLLGCGGSGDGSDGSSNVNVSGTWVGSTQSQAGFGSAQFALTLSQNGSNVSGTWACISSCAHASGTISGTISGSTFTASLVFPDTHSCGAFDANISGNSMSGDFACSDPLGNDFGTWSAAR